MKAIIRFLKGLIIGAGLITPGVSGGILAIILNLYEEMLNAINTFFKHFRNNFNFLFPIILGILFGVFLFGNVLMVLFTKYESIAKFAFSGFIIGSIPFLFKKTEGLKKLNKPIFIILVLLMTFLLLMEKERLNFDVSTVIDNNQSYLRYFIMGFLYISGKVIPGLSSSVLLILIGQYEYFLRLVSSPFNLQGGDYVNVLFILFGMLIGGILVVKLMSFALKKYTYLTYSVIVAFVISSVIALIPTVNGFTIKDLVGLMVLFISMFCSFHLSNRKGC